MNRPAGQACKPAITDAPASSKANHTCLKAGSGQTEEMVSEADSKYQTKGQ